MAKRLIRVEHVEAFVTPAPPHVPVISCHLEDGRIFTLYYVPPDVVLAINKMQDSGYAEPGERESLFELLLSFNNIVKEIGSLVDRVVINEIDRNTYLYTAVLELKLDSIRIKRRMIPSHAVYLALLSGSPIYVDEKLVEEQERMEQDEGLGSP